MKVGFPPEGFENSQISNFSKIRPREPSVPYGQTDGQT